MMMETHRLVITEDLNQYGKLFGGKILSWVDEACFIAATLEFPDCQFVTIGMNKVEFSHGVTNGAILAIRSERVRLGTTSVTYGVEVMLARGEKREVIFSTEVTFVNVDADGKKVKIERE